MLDSPDEQLQSETRSVPNSNVVSERDFARLDWLLREKPNATTLSIEALILFSSNKTGAWLERKAPEEKEALFRKVRRLAPEFKELYKQRQKGLLEDKAKVLRAKQLALQRLSAKRVIEKEKLTEAIMVYGLWQNETQV